MSLQRAGITDIILSEDDDLTHLGARPGSVEAFYDGKWVVGSCTKVPLDESSRLQEQDPVSPRQPLLDIWTQRRLRSAI